jgi:acyl-CoA thioesterase
VHQEPADILEFRKVFGSIDWQREISATFGGAIVAQALAWFQIRAFEFDRWQFIHLQ